jgi:CHASE2 domain-containing sensor protein
MSPLGGSLRRLSYDLPFLLRPNVAGIATNGVVIVYLDDLSQDQLTKRFGKDRDRALHARLLQRLTRDKPNMVLFDMLFTEPGPDRAADEELAQAIRDHGNVILGAQLERKANPNQVTLISPSPVYPPFRDAAADVGLVDVSRDSDQGVREHFRGIPGIDLASLAWTAARHKHLEITTAPEGRFVPRWLNYYGPHGTIPSLNYVTALDEGKCPSGFFRNKIILIGAGLATGSWGTAKDEHANPYTRWNGSYSFGVEVHATALLNLLRGDWLRRSSPWVELAIVLFCGAAFGYGAARLRPRLAAGCGVLAGGSIALLAYFLFRQQHWWCPWCIVTFVQIPCAVGWSVLDWADPDRASLHRGSSAHPPVVVVSPGDQRFPLRPAELARGADSAPTCDFGPPPVPDHQLLRRVGRGSYGEVWLAKSLSGSYRAVKIVRQQPGREDRPWERELAGITKFEPISRLHPNLVNILHVGLDQATRFFYCILELADDLEPDRTFTADTYQPKTLRAVIDRQGTLAPAECGSIGAALTSALNFLHERGLVHRDIKPGNVIFVSGVPKLADIGLVTDADAASSIVGTSGYLPPEGPGTIQADIYSLGKVLYEMATGLNRTEFPQWPLSREQARAPGQAEQLRTIIERACEPSLSRRYARAIQMEADLRRLAALDKNPASPP